MVKLRVPYRMLRRSLAVASSGVCPSGILLAGAAEARQNEQVSMGEQYK